MQELFIGQAPDIPEPLHPTSSADITRGFGSKILNTCIYLIYIFEFSTKLPNHRLAFEKRHEGGVEVQECRAPGRRTSSLHRDVRLLAVPAIPHHPRGSNDEVQ